MSNDLFQTESETALLSILLQNPNLAYDLSGLRSFMFSSTPNQTLFSVIQDLLSEGLVPEISLIDNYLKAKNKDTMVGGREYLNYLFKQSYNHDNSKQFEKLIIDSYKARTLISTVSQVSSQLMSSSDIDGTIGILRNSIDKLLENSGGERVVNFKDALKDAWEGIKYRIDHPGIKGISTGIPTIDAITYGMNSGKLWIISGRPSMGKSATIVNFIYNQTKVGIPILLFSLEMNRTDLSERLLALHTGEDLSNISLGLLSDASIARIEEGIREIKEYPIYLDTTFSTNLEYVISTIRKYVKFYGVKVAYLDYIQLLVERDSEATNEIGKVTRALKLLSEELGITIVALSQLHRGVESRPDKRPIPSDMRQSGNIEEDADIVVGLYRDEIYNRNTNLKGILEFIISKHRDGKIGVVSLNFNTGSCKITGI